MKNKRKPELQDALQKYPKNLCIYYIRGCFITLKYVNDEKK